MKSIMAWRDAGIAVLVSLLVACGGRESQSNGQSSAAAPKVVDVGYVIVQPAQVPLTVELSGRTTAFETSEVRPQVSGLIRRQSFTEGSITHAGQTLYEIDPSLYQSTASQARANLASARANATAAQARAERYRALIQSNVISQQDLADAEAQAGQAQAAVQQAQAQLETARINLRYTNVPAPISGRIGRSLFTVGALVTANQSEPLAVIQRLDPIFVDIQQSSADLLTLRRALAANGVTPTSAEVTLTLEDGSAYEHAGTVEFAEAMVNESTGTVTLRARFANSAGLLLPGMFVRAKFAQAVNTRAFLVPQTAVARDPRGNATVLSIDVNNKVQQRPISADRAAGSNWVVTKGLAAGDKIIVEGTAKVRPGQTVRAVPAGSPQNLGQPNSSGGA
jgi:membrane fusion protein (multidrug efflux system)